MTTSQAGASSQKRTRPAETIFTTPPGTPTIPKRQRSGNLAEFTGEFHRFVDVLETTAEVAHLVVGVISAAAAVAASTVASAVRLWNDQIMNWPSEPAERTIFSSFVGGGRESGGGEEESAMKKQRGKFF